VRTGGRKVVVVIVLPDFPSLVLAHCKAEATRDDLPQNQVDP
jgi:hypothetical protein